MPSPVQRNTLQHVVAVATLVFLMETASGHHKGSVLQCVAVCAACCCVELVRQPCRLLVGPKNPAENTFGNPGHAEFFLVHVCFYVPIS